MLFTLPACVEEPGVTVVVVPYRALIEDLVRRIQQCGVECMEWKHGENNPASVVVVSADVAGDIKSVGNFLGYARMLLLLPCSATRCARSPDAHPTTFWGITKMRLLSHAQQLLS